MTLHLQKDLQQLKASVLGMSEAIADRVRRAIDSLVEHDTELAEQVIAGDAEIDDLEVRIEEEALKILALHQPVATDLRLVIALLKVNSDLERVGDLAVNVAERARFLATQPGIGIRLDLARMGEAALGFAVEWRRNNFVFNATYLQLIFSDEFEEQTTNDGLGAISLRAIYEF